MDGHVQERLDLSHTIMNPIRKGKLRPKDEQMITVNSAKRERETEKRC